MQVGDILLCSGNAWLSKRIKAYNKIILHAYGEAAEISHVAMIGPKDDEVFEATTLNEWSGKKGVQFNHIVDWILNYDGKVWIRKANNGVTASHRIKMQAEMVRLIGIPYEHGIPGMMELAFAGISLPWISGWVAQRLRTDTNLHCSEADALVLQYAQLLSTNLRPNKLPPCVWYNGLVNNYYDPPILIKG